MTTRPNAPDAEQAARDALAALPPAERDEARRIFSITVGVLDALEYGYIAALTWDDEGLYSLYELADSCARVARYAAEGYRLAPGAAFGLAWDEAHLEQCHDPRCPFTVHTEADAAALADPDTTPVTRQVAAGRTEARRLEIEREARAARTREQWEAPATNAAEAAAAREARAAERSRLAAEVHDRHQADAAARTARPATR